MLIAGFPPDSATASAVNRIPRGWTTQAFLTADVVHALTGQPHPARPSLDGKTPEEKSKARIAALLDHKRRMAERDKALAAAAEPTA